MNEYVFSKRIELIIAKFIKKMYEPICTMKKANGLNFDNGENKG